MAESESALAPGRPRGRPRKPGAATVRRQIRLPAPLLAQIEASAERSGLAVDAWVRDACAAKLKR